MKIINVTPHPIRFRRQDGSEYEITPCGVRLGAEFQEEPAGERSGASLVRIRVVPARESTEKLAAIEAENPEAIIVDSLMGAQAFPGRVVALIAAGHERGTAHADRRYCDWKFTTF